MNQDRPKTASSVQRNSVDMFQFFSTIVEDLQTISNRLYLLENKLQTNGNHPYPKALSSVRHRDAIKLAREIPE